MKKSLFVFTVLLLCSSVFSQEILKSIEEDYFYALSLTGDTERNYINYRDVASSEWNVSAEDTTPWQDKNLGTIFVYTPGHKYDNWFVNGIDRSLKFKLYSPEWYNSYNTANPFGQNDGALWQGRGYNTSMTAGFNAKAYGLEISFRPMISFSQNLDFELIPTKYSNGYGYWYSADSSLMASGLASCDYLQRYGEDPFWTFDWGDTEIRYNFYTFTVGFGTSAVWIGPATQNPLLLSNNAATFPKLDFGLKRTSMYLPYLDWYMGDIELRYWIGRLGESAYFDDNADNDYRLFTGWSLAWSVPHIQGLSLGFSKVCQCYWDDRNIGFYFNPFYSLNVIRTNSSRNVGGEDQKASFTVDWIMEKAGFELYAEIGVDDYLANGLKAVSYFLYPFHTMTYTVGFNKDIPMKRWPSLRGIVSFEFDFSEYSRDYNNWQGNYQNFGFHHQVRQGYTNKGQWLGSGYGYGGNSQYLSFTLYSPHGYDKFFVARNNPDNNYVSYQSKMGNTNDGRWYQAYKANFYTGVETMWFIPGGFSVKAGITYDLIINPLYKNEVYYKPTLLNNWQFNLLVRYTL